MQVATQVVTDGPLAGKELDRETHTIQMKGQKGAYLLRGDRLRWVPSK